jgi:hypothetical protein
MYRSRPLLKSPATLAVTAVLLAGAHGVARAQDWVPRTKRAAPPALAPSIRGIDNRSTLADLLERRLRVAELLPPPVAYSAADIVPETEPNDTIPEGNLVTLGDTVDGVIDPAGDFDYFAVQLATGTVLDLDVDAVVLGSAMDPIIALFDVDSVTILAVNDDWDGLDSRIAYAIPVDGLYFVGITDLGGNGGSAYTYRLKFGELTLNELEPNNSAGEANLIAFGDTTFATLTPATDIDFFAIDVPDSTLIAFELQQNFNTWFDGVLVLYDVNGTTPLVTDTVWNWPPVLEYLVEASGRYFLSVSDLSPDPLRSPLYGLIANSLARGPGDPSALVAVDLGCPGRMAAGEQGELYVADECQGRVLEVATDGTVTEFAQNLGGDLGLAVDGFGDLLVSGYDNQRGVPVIWQVLAGGAREVLIDNRSTTGPITVGPDGDIWALECGQRCPAVQRYDPLGSPKEVIDLAEWAWAMAFSPAGELHYTAGSSIFKLVGTASEVVIQDTTFSIWYAGLAFDEAGNLYAASPPYPGRILMHDDAYQPVHDPFARFGGAEPIGIAFGRSASGAMTSRLSVAAYDYREPDPGRLFELNPDGVVAPGFRIGTDLLRVVTTELDTATVGAPYEATVTMEDPPGTVTWSVIAGSLPPGIDLNVATGVLSGTPEQSGHFDFTLRVDGESKFGFANLFIAVVDPVIATQDVVNAILGIDGLITPEVETFLDLQGNENGQFDIGDVQAYLRARGQISAPALDAIANAAERRNRQ